jgi:DNA-binding IclR family transcriptional regulator
MGTVSGIGVLDKAFSVVDALETGPLSLAGLVEATGLPRATAHRLAAALEAHGLVRRDGEGRFAVGPRLTGLDLPALAAPVLERLRDGTGESAQLYVRRGDRRVCVASLESPHGLRTIVAVGASLPLDVGSAGKVLRGEESTEERGWAESVEERELGVASVSAPVYGPAGDVVAAVSVSGPIERTSRSPGSRYADAVQEAARAIEARLGG